RFIAEPLPTLTPATETAAPATSQAGEGASPAAEAGVPAEALTGAEREGHFRPRDPLGGGSPAPGAARRSRWPRGATGGGGGSWCGCPPVGHTWSGIAGCATAWLPPSRFPFPIRLADPSDSPLRCLPHVGVRGWCASAAGPGRCSVTDGLDAPGLLPYREGV